MAKNYGKRRLEPGRKNILGRVLLVFVSFTSGYLMASVFDLASLSTWIDKRFLQHNKPQQVVRHSPQKTQVVKPKFEFYTLLAKGGASTVQPIPSRPPTFSAVQQKEVEVSTPPAPIEATKPQVVESQPVHATKEQYLLQVAAFNKRQDAEHLKANLVLTGFDVALSPVLKNETTWYRVMIGPFTSQKEAEKAKLMVAHNYKMMGMVKRV